MKKLLLFWGIFCCLLSCLQAQEFIVLRNNMGHYVYMVKNHDEDIEVCKPRFLIMNTTDSVYNKIKKDIRASLPPIVNDWIEQAIEKKVKPEEFKESFEDFTYTLFIDKEGNVARVVIFLSETMREKFTEEMIKDTYNCLMKVKIDMHEVSLENANEFDYFMHHDSPVMEGKRMRREMQEDNMESNKN